MISKNEIEELRRLIRAGSAGPWEAIMDEPGSLLRRWKGVFYINEKNERKARLSWCCYGAQTDEHKHAANAELAAAAVTVLPGLLNLVEKLYIDLFEVTCDRDAIKRHLEEEGKKNNE